MQEYAENLDSQHQKKSTSNNIMIILDFLFYTVKTLISTIIVVVPNESVEKKGIGPSPQKGVCEMPNSRIFFLDIFAVSAKPSPT